MCNRLTNKDFNKELDRLQLRSKETLWVKSTHKSVEEETVLTWHLMLVIDDQRDCLGINAS